MKCINGLRNDIPPIEKKSKEGLYNHTPYFIYIYSSRRALAQAAHAQLQDDASLIVCRRLVNRKIGPLRRLGWLAPARQLYFTSRPTDCRIMNIQEENIAVEEEGPQIPEQTVLAPPARSSTGILAA